MTNSESRGDFSQDVFNSMNVEGTDSFPGEIPAELRDDQIKGLEEFLDFVNRPIPLVDDKLPIAVRQFMEEQERNTLQMLARQANRLSIPLKRLDPAAVLPAQAKKSDAGYDLHALESGYILPGQRAVVRTGISLAIPPGFYGRIAPRSGLAVKSGIDVLAGVIDSTYRGEIKVALINLSDGGEEDVFHWSAGDRIAQLIIEKCHEISWCEVENLDETDRGQGGFGHSGR